MVSKEGYTTWLVGTRESQRSDFAGKLNASVHMVKRKAEPASMLSIICPVVNTGTLTEYFLANKHWETLISELNDPDTSDEEKIKEIRKKYGEKRRNALASICVCDPPLEAVELLVRLGGKKDSEKEAVNDSGHCGFTSLHYACWGNASLEVIKYLSKVGGKRAVLTRTKRGGATALHLACIRYKSPSLPDLIRHLIKLGKHEVATALDNNDEFPLQCLLLRSGALPVESIVTYLEEWYEIEKYEGVAFSRPKVAQNRSQLLDSDCDSSSDDLEIFKENENPTNGGYLAGVQFRDNFNKVLRQLIKADPDSRSQILTTEFMMEYLTERFIQPLPLAILIMDLYVQILVVCVYSFFISNTSPNPVDSMTTANILIFCVVWRLLREVMQVMTTSFGSYIFDVSNWLDISQSVLILLTIQTDLDDFSMARRNLLIFPTIIAWIEFFFELHNFMYDLAIFVGATFKCVKRLANFGYSLVFIVAMFAHVYYISGTGEICDGRETLAKDTFNDEGAFTCSRTESYAFSIVNVFEFTFPSKIPLAISCFYAFLMGILFLNVIIAVISDAFEDAQNESEVEFWSDRLMIVNELGNITSGIYYLTARLSKINPRMNSMLIKSSMSHSPSNRYNLNLLLEKSAWDKIPENDKSFIYWWYGKWEERPSFVTRISFFLTKSRLEDVFIPGTVFENILLGNKRSQVTNRLQRLLILPCSIIFMIGSNTLIVFMIILGFVTLGLAWPYKMKQWLFTVTKGKNKVTNVTEKKNEEISEMKIIFAEMRNEINENKLQTAELLSKLNLLLMKSSTEL